MTLEDGHVNKSKMLRMSANGFLPKLKEMDFLAFVNLVAKEK